jgi:hypothetical protein
MIKYKLNSLRKKGKVSSNRYTHTIYKKNCTSFFNYYRRLPRQTLLITEIIHEEQPSTAKRRIYIRPLCIKLLCIHPNY